MKCSKMPFRSNWLIVCFKFSVSSLIFCLFLLAVIERGLLKVLIVTRDFSTLPFLFYWGAFWPASFQLVSLCFLGWQQLTTVLSQPLDKWWHRDSVRHTLWDLLSGTSSWGIRIYRSWFLFIIHRECVGHITVCTVSPLISCGDAFQ